MADVAIIGVGLHPFGRFGPKSAIDMTAEAGTPRVGYAQLYGAPGTAGVSILSP